MYNSFYDFFLCFGLAVGVVSNAEYIYMFFSFFDGVSFGNVIDLLLCSVLIIG